MLDDLFERHLFRAWHRGTIFSPYLDGWVEELAAQGFRPAALRGKLCVASWFAEYLRSQGIHVMGDITTAHADGFIAAGRRKPGDQEKRRKAVSDLLRHLEGRGAWVPAPKPPRTGPVEDHFRSLAEERGLSPATVKNRRRYVGRFLTHAGCGGLSASSDSLSKLTTKDVDRFIVEMGRSYGRAAMGTWCCAIRGLLRYLHRVDVHSSDLSVGVLMPRYYKLERQPCALPWATVQQIVNAVDTTTPRGRRDLAMLWLLVAYGLRGGEVEKLRIEDIDWRRQLLHVRRSKAGRPLKLPLTHEVGEAILAYLRDGRPKTKCREIFVRVNAPYTPLRFWVGHTVTHYLRKADIKSRHGGARVIRHSFAVHLIRQGEPLKTITDLLGHRDPSAAHYYTKLATEDLREVALPVSDVTP